MISVIIPVKDAERLIKRCCDSVFNVCNDMVEIVVVDYNSTDNTKEEVCGWNKSNVRYIEIDKAGIYYAMNIGIKLAKNDYLYFMGADDYLLPGFKDAIGTVKNDEKLISVFKVGGLIGDEEVSYKDKTSVKKLFRFSRGRFFSPNQQAIIYNKKCFDLYGDFDERYQLVADADHFLRCIDAGISAISFYGTYIAAVGKDGASSDFLKVWAENLLITSRGSRRPSQSNFIFDGIVSLLRYWVREIKK